MAAIVGVQDLDMRLSGGAANADPDLSLGGDKSSVRVASQVPVFDAAGITGVTLVDGAGFDPNGILTGHQLNFLNATTVLNLNPNGVAQGPDVDVSVDDRYVLRAPTISGFPYVIVYVVAASLPVADTSDIFAVTPQVNNLWDDVSGIEQAEGSVEFRCIYLETTHPSKDKVQVTVFFDDSDRLEFGEGYAIGLDPAGINGTATTIVDEETAPGGVTFDPNAQSEGLAISIGNMAPGDFQAVWFRRSITGSTLNAGGTSFAFLEATMLLDI